MTTGLFVPTTAADIRDQHWLDLQIDKIKESVADAGERLQDIAANWDGNRGLARLHPGVAAKDYVLDRLGVMGPTVIVPLLESTNWSNRQIAAIAGVSEGTVRNAKAGAQIYAPEPDAPPARVIGADGKSYPGRVVHTTTAEIIEPDEPASGPQFRAEIVTSVLAEWLAVDPAAAATSIPKSYLPNSRASLKRAHAWIGAVIAELDKR